MAIIGHGDLAQALTDRPDVTFMAAGVSNSKETSPVAFQREMKLLLNQPRERHLVYFSSLCIYYAKTEYARHKRIMEATIKNHFPGYTIVRIGNISFGTNKNTLLNFIRNKIALNEEVVIEDTYRYVCDREEFSHWISMIQVPGKDIMNVTGKMMKVADIYEAIKTGRL